MSRLRRLGALAVLAILCGVWFGTPAAAFAHALLVRSDPAADVVLKQAPTRIHLWFSEDLNGSASKIVVWDRYRHDEEIGNARLVPGQSRQLQIGLKHLVPGAYLVLWTSVSAEDGHVLRGSYIFYVEHRGPGPSLAGISLGGPGQGFPDGPTLAALLAHWLELLSAVTFAGAAALSTFVVAPLSATTSEGLEREHRRSRELVSASLIALLGASTVVIALQAYDLAGNNWSGIGDGGVWSSVFAVQYGQLWIGRQVLAVVGLFGVLVVGRRSWPRTAAAVTGLGLLYLLLFAGSGHGASAAIGTVSGSRVVSISVGVDWLHFIADSLWFGGQIGIALAIIPAFRPREEDLSAFLAILNRFSPMAYLSVALFSLSGLFNAKIHIPSWYAFFNAIYGRGLIIKVVLIGCMMLVSMLTVFGIRPAIRRALAAGEHDRARNMRNGLFFWLRLNPVLGAGVLLATSVLFYYPVPLGFGPPGPSTYTTSASGITATLSLKPDRSGPNTITVHLSDVQHRPITKANVTILTNMLDMVMGQGLGITHQKQPGVFSGVTDLGMGGHWRLTLLVYRPKAELLRLPVDVTVGT